MFAKNLASLSLAAASLVAQVAAHGYVDSVTVGGTWYGGFDEARWENNKRQDSPVLITAYLHPTYDVWHSNITCGGFAQPPRVVAPINAGESVAWNWRTHSWKPWTHTMGTHRSFIGSCRGDCKTVDPGSINWIELSEEYTGRQNYDSGSMQWPVQVLFDGNTWSDRIPSLPAGQYLLRNELTAFHYSDKPVGSWDQGHPWGTEFYPSCVAIEIKNTDASFHPSTTYKFPGAYDPNQPGHYNPDVHVRPELTVLAQLHRGEGYSSDYNSTPNTNEPPQNSGGDPPPANNDTPPSSSAAAYSAPTHSICTPGTRRALAAKARKMRRAHRAHRRSEH